MELERKSWCVVSNFSSRRGAVGAEQQRGARAGP